MAPRNTNKRRERRSTVPASSERSVWDDPNKPDWMSAFDWEMWKIKNQPSKWDDPDKPEWMSNFDWAMWKALQARRAEGAETSRVPVSYDPEPVDVGKLLPDVDVESNLFDDIARRRATGEPRRPSVSERLAPVERPVAANQHPFAPTPNVPDVRDITGQGDAARAFKQKMDAQLDPSVIEAVSSDPFEAVKRRQALSARTDKLLPLNRGGPASMSFAERYGKPKSRGPKDMTLPAALAGTPEVVVRDQYGRVVPQMNRTDGIAPPTRPSAPVADARNARMAAAEKRLNRRKGTVPGRATSADAAERQARPTAGGGNFLTNSILGATKAAGAVAGEQVRAEAAAQAEWEAQQAAAERAREQALQSAIAASRLSLPDRNSYLAPYVQAEAAANESFNAGKGVITGAFGELRGDLDRNQSEFVADQGAVDQQQAMERRLIAAQEAESFKPSGLSQDLGLAPGLAQEQALLSALSQQGATAADNLADRMTASQAQDFKSRQEGVGHSEASAMANAQNNLQALLGKIGLSKADAERQYTNDVNAIQQQNQANERAIRDQFLAQQQQQMADMERFEKQQLKLLKDSETDPWDGDILDTRLQANPVAMGQFFLPLIQDFGGPRNARTGAALKAQLDDYLTAFQEETGRSLDKATISKWIDDYYSNRRVIDENKFVRFGGDPSYLGRSYG